MGDGIFVISGSLDSGDARLIEMAELPYQSEDVLQSLLEKYPNLLAGTQVNPEAPRRWLLLKREQAVPDRLDGKERWSLDHLLIDQDGIPTLVEVKRSTDTRVRREVVGQMLDYAANGIAYWPPSEIRAAFAATVEDASATIAEALGPDVDPAQLWANLETNLGVGNIRLIFVADEIPKELRRIVEFLNGQMRAEVLAVEVKQFASAANDQLRTLVARVYGRTETSASAKSGTPLTKQWDESSFFAELESKFPAGAPTARKLLEWAKGRGLTVVWGRGAQVGSFNVSAGTTTNLSNAYILAVRTNGRFEIGFGYLRNTVPFAPQERRRDLLGRLKTVPGLTWLSPEQADKYPNAPLASIEPDQSYEMFIDVLTWAVTQFPSSTTPGVG